MSVLSPLVILIVLLTAIAGALLGHLIGNKRTRKQRRQLQHDLNQQSLQMLDIKADLTKLEKRRDQFARKDRVLKLTLKKLAVVTELTNKLKVDTQTQERQHFMQMSRLRVAAAESRQQAQRAAKIATIATAQLKKLEAHYTQTVNAPNRDLMRLSRKSSSNEGQRFSADSLQAIAGISPELERTLNDAGIHHIEQLAAISDRALIDLPIPITEAQSIASRANWKSGAKEWMVQRTNA